MEGMMRLNPAPARVALRRSFLTLIGAIALVAALFSGVPAVKASTVIYVGMNQASNVANTSCKAPRFGTLSYASDPDATIQAAITFASEGDIVHICQGTWNLSSTAGERPINTSDHLNTNSKSITLRGDGRDKTILKAINFGRLISSSDAGGGNWEPLTFQNIELQGGNVSWSGGAVAAAGVTCINSDFVNNSADAGRGGAIYSEGPVDIRSCRFVGNDATDDGGAVAVDAYPLTVSASAFTGNVSGECGGAIYVSNALGTVDKSQFERNTADSSGAYCGNLLGELVVSGSVFRSNRALDDIGAVEAYEVTSSRNQFINNVADGANGALQFCFGSLDRDTFQGNRSSTGYAALDAACSLTGMSRTTFTRNIAGAGASIAHIPSAAQVLRNTFSSNQMSRGSVVTVCSRDEMVAFLRQNTLKSNSGGPATEIVGCFG
jgi:predicted outer membrane repeat protein